MDGRFFENLRRPETIRGGDPFCRYRRPTQHATPKVVQIPVRFVNSDEGVDRSGFASRIQKVYRGFRVRKCVKKIREMEFEIEGVEERIKVVDLRDWKERVKMNETLMSLLLKLDSISGMDSGVRALRKAVIRKAIILQERIDSMAGVDSEANGVEIAKGAELDSAVVVPAAGVVENAVEPLSCIEASTGDHHELSMDAIAGVDSEVNGGEVSPGTEPASAFVARAAAVCENAEEPVSCIQESMEDHHESSIAAIPTVDSDINSDGIAQRAEPTSAVVARAAAVCENVEEPISYMEASMVDATDHHEAPMDAIAAVSSEAKGGNIASGTEGRSTAVVRANTVCENAEEPLSCIESSMEDTIDHSELTIDGEVSDRHRDDGVVAPASEEKESNDNSELLKRMAEENARMLKMMEQLCERNEAQARMLNALNQRVGNLEKVFVCDLIRRRRKKKKVASGCETCAP